MKKFNFIGPCYMADEDGGTGGIVDSSWRGSLPEDLKNHPGLQDFKDVPGLAKSYLDNQKYIGKDKIVIPGEDDTDGWNNVYSKLGRPEKAEDYEYNAPEELKGLPVDEEAINNARQKFYELGLSKKQAAGLFELYNNGVISKVQGATDELNKARTLSEETLKLKWGAAYNQNFDIAKNAVTELGDPNLVKTLNETGLGNDSRVIEMFYNIGLKISEDSAKGGNRGGTFISTPEQAKSKIAELHADDKFMAVYNSNTHPEHKAAVQKMADLFKQAYPENK